jgi:Family of unknown function (DUF6352)
MKDFWLSCGHHLLDRDEHGRLRVTDEFMKVYLARPELAPPPEACVVERTLHSALLSDPWRPVAAAEIDAITEADARENWQFMIAFRDRLAGHLTLEAAYTALVCEGVRVPPIFLDQLVHLILRNTLDQCDDAYMLRAAELFFRPQRVTVHEGSLLAADEEQIDTNGPAFSPLASMFGLPARLEIEVLSDDSAPGYWNRSDRFDLALDLTAGRRGLAALGTVFVCWVKHLLDIDVMVEPLNELRNVALAWYVGLDVDGTRIGDALWNGTEIDDATRAKVVGLFQLTFRDAGVVIDRMAGEPVYLILAMTPDKILRIKPQNLLTGLPIRHLETVT